MAVTFLKEIISIWVRSNLRTPASIFLWHLRAFVTTFVKRTPSEVQELLRHSSADSSLLYCKGQTLSHPYAWWPCSEEVSLAVDMPHYHLPSKPRLTVSLVRLRKGHRRFHLQTHRCLPRVCCGSSRLPLKVLQRSNLVVIPTGKYQSSETINAANYH